MTEVCTVCGEPATGGLILPGPWVDYLREQYGYTPSGPVRAALCKSHEDRLHRLNDVYKPHIDMPETTPEKISEVLEALSIEELDESVR